MGEEAFRTFEEPVASPDGTVYTATACGRLMSDGRWEGWIEFEPETGWPILRSRRETTQPDRASIAGWASRLGHVYLEGALERALDIERPRPRLAVPIRRPHFDGPAPPRGSPVTPDDAALNPFLTYRAGIDELTRALRRLSAAELRTMIRAYDLDPAQRLDIEALDRGALVELVLGSVTERLGT